MISSNLKGSEESRPSRSVQLKKSSTAFRYFFCVAGANAALIKKSLPPRRLISRIKFGRNPRQQQSHPAGEKPCGHRTKTPEKRGGAASALGEGTHSDERVGKETETRTKSFTMFYGPFDGGGHRPYLEDIDVVRVRPIACDNDLPSILRELREVPCLVRTGGPPRRHHAKSSRGSVHRDSAGEQAIRQRRSEEWGKASS